MRSATYEPVPAGSPLTARQWRGLQRLGDAVIPGDDVLPRFSASGCAAGIDRMLPYMYAADRDAFLALCSAAAHLPAVAVTALVRVASAPERGGPLAPALRMANIGIKGVIMSLYWSDIGAVPVLPAVGYATAVHMRDPEPNTAANMAGAQRHTGSTTEPS